MNIDPEPIGSASIAQVHRARIGPKQESVAIKVVRQHAQASIQGSFDALQSTLHWAHKWLPSASDACAPQQTQLLLEDACSMLKAELDMGTEHVNMVAFADVASSIKVPQPLSHHLGGRVLVMQLVAAPPLATVYKSLAPQVRSGLAQQMAAWWLESVVRHRLVHGDPHIGNWGLQGDDLVLYDYGNVVSIQECELHAIFQLLESLTALAVRVSGASFFKARAQSAGSCCGVHVLNWDAFQGDTRMLMQYLTAPGSVELDPDQMAARRCVPARLSGPALQLVRSLILVDGVCRALDPGFAWRL
jgi:predicted unusual protein kinase regulating ubiquinone biosynthesis (AarF/ABC1/UbiB family)